MDTSFTFPRHPPPVTRPPPASSSTTSPTASSNLVNRESNALRASVLDAALELGLGTNSTVADWMFNNSLPEEEEEDLRSPALTYGSTATSEESSSSARLPSTPSLSSHTSSNLKQSNGSPADNGLYMVPERPAPSLAPSLADTNKSAIGSVGSIAFPEIPIPPRPVTPMGTIKGKLRKKRGDGYESDGGYVSESGKKKKKKDKVKEDSTGGIVDGELNKKERAKEAKNRAKEEKVQEKKEKEEERKRKKSLVTMGKANKKGPADDKELAERLAAGYETDGPAKGVSRSKSSKKVKSKTSGDGYETDSGYLSSTPAKAKAKRFFRIGTKQLKPDLQKELSPTSPTTIEREPMPLPIASRFATMLGSTPTNSSISSNLSTQPNDQSLGTTYPPLPIAATSPSIAPLSFTASPTFSASPPSAFHSPISSPNAVSDPRESFTSAESVASASASSNSSHARRRGVQFLGHENSHDGGSGSYSTVTSAAQVPLSPSAVSSPTPSARAFPAISLPWTHSSASSPTHTAYPHSPSPNPGNQTLPPNALSPARLSPPYSFSNGNSRNPSPSHSPGLSTPGSPYIQVSSPTSSASSTPPLRVRPRFPPTDGFGPRHATSPTSTPLPNSGLSSPNILSPVHTPNSVRMPGSEQTLHPPTQRPALSIVASSNYVVPSPRATQLPSPNVLAYYDIPPPSPPPVGPLPSVPPPRSLTRTPTSRGGGSASGIARSKTPDQGLFSQPIPSIQRGRESPFPSRPILPSAGASAGAAGVGVGLEATVKVPRYRELYGLAIPRGNDVRASVSQRSEGPGIDVVEPTEDGWGEREFYDAQEEEDMRDVLDRFEEARMGGRRSPLDGTALGRSQSFEAIKNRLTGGSSESEYYDEDGDASRKSSMEEGGGKRASRWSGSIYSRASFLDTEKSEEARQRLLQRVGDMYEEGGKERYVPPVPKLPKNYAAVAGNPPAPGRSWNRF